MADNFQRALDEQYRKMREAGMTHQEAMERLRIASARAVKQVAAEIVAEVKAKAEPQQ